MLVPSLFSLAVSVVAVLFSLSTNEEIVQVMARGVAAISLVVSLVLAPWLMLLILSVPVIGAKLVKNAG
ncbi:MULTISPECIES: hypothetical protein [Planktothrix]|jgi:hypothetical protein|uniref:Uncharacterized protein n=2 Tax=Planktothrix TaxID=54304 RepID=A0A479ZPE2_PLAAG|nr:MULTISPECIES: hypothetical protein [Planktothrix]GCL34570.1 hypothetical protein PA905_07830 [Planktothrix agardhii CCAP 1459/11A]CAC5343778.1 putative membrane protein [Planktothrix rubescens NIVA-CYA 18]CAD5959524.1 hypothetical protein NO108_03447 [Planktothrix rubescens]CAD5981065.1 hypothetical protein PCC7821_04708 [Planktothrix rubescens NIVA-CYA 18]